MENESRDMENEASQHPRSSNPRKVQGHIYISDIYASYIYEFLCIRLHANERSQILALSDVHIACYEHSI